MPIADVRTALRLDTVASPDAIIEAAMIAAERVVLPLLDPPELAAHEQHADCIEALLFITGQVLQQRRTPGGVASTTDGAPARYLLGRGMLARVEGMLTGCRAIGIG